MAACAGNYEKSLELSPSATLEYTRGATGNRNYRGISGGIIDNAIGGIVDYTGTTPNRFSADSGWCVRSSHALVRREMRD